jgi:hypothetical protein
MVEYSQDHCRSNGQIVEALDPWPRLLSVDHRQTAELDPPKL